MTRRTLRLMIIKNSDDESHLREKKFEAHYLFLAGVVYYDYNNFSKAERMYSKALRIYSGLAQKDPDISFNVATSLNNIGCILLDTGKFQEAEKSYTEALALYRTLTERDSDTYNPYLASVLYSLGILYMRNRQLQQAEDVYTEALKIRRLIAEKDSAYVSDLADTLNNIGGLYFEKGDFPCAQHTFCEALTLYRILAEKDPDTYIPDVAMTLSNQGIIFQNAGDFLHAEEAYSEALTLYRELTKRDHTFAFNVAVTLNNLGLFYWKNGKFQEAEKSYAEALSLYKTLAEKNPDTYIPDVALTLGNVGLLYSETGKFQEAEKSYTEALSLYKTLAEKNPDTYIFNVAGILNNLGLFYSSTKRFKQAEKSYIEALTFYQELAEEDPDTYIPHVAMALNNIGTVFKDVGKFSQAEDVYTEALTHYQALAEEDPDTYIPHVAMALSNLGNLYKDTGKFSQAEEAFTEALKGYRALAEKDPDVYAPDVAMTLSNLGALYWDTQQFSQAEEAFTEALKIRKALAKENPDTYIPYVGSSLNSLGLLYADTARIHEAEKTYDEALEVTRFLVEKNPQIYLPGLAVDLNNLGSLYWDTHRFSQAEEAFKEALKIRKALAKENPDVYEPDVAMILNNLGNLYWRTGELKKAEKMYSKAFKIRKRKMLWFEVAESLNGLSLISHEKTEDAVRTLELAILFSGEEKYKYVQKGKREEIYFNVLEYTDNPYKIFGILEALRDSDLLSLRWDLEEIERAKKDENLQKTLMKNVGKQRISPVGIPFQIRDDVLFLYIQNMEDTVLYVMVTKEGIRIFKHTPEFFDYGKKLVVNLRVQMLGALYRKDICDIAAKFDIISKKWVHTLPTEIQNLLCEKDTIIFSPDAALSYFPLEGLVTDGEPICLSKKVVRATSIHQLHEITSTPPVIDSSLIVGNPWPPTDEDSVMYSHPSTVGPIRYLGNAEKEAQALAKYLPNPKPLLNALATADTFLKEVSNYSLIHFAGHGYLGRILFFSGPMTRVPPEFEADEFSQLRKAWRSVNGKTKYMMDEWDFITDIDILGTPLKKGAFVFLSACETGKHKYAGGGHFQGLAQAFLKSGASNVISSLIPLYDEPSRDFALSFYRNLSHKSVSTALQDTREIMKKKYKAHIYWLPYIHYGSPLELDSL